MNFSISLAQSDADFVAEKVASGRFGSSSEVVQAALRLLRQAEDQSEALAGLREAWEAGLSSGDFGEIDFAALKAEARESGARRKPES